MVHKLVHKLAHKLVHKWAHKLAHKWAHKLVRMLALTKRNTVVSFWVLNMWWGKLRLFCKCIITKNKNHHRTWMWWFFVFLIIIIFLCWISLENEIDVDFLRQTLLGSFSAKTKIFVKSIFLFAHSIAASADMNESTIALFWWNFKILRKHVTDRQSFFGKKIFWFGTKIIFKQSYIWCFVKTKNN